MNRSLARSAAITALASGVLAAGTAAGLAFVPVAGSFAGTLVGALVLGLATDDRPVAETAVAAVLVRLGVVGGAATLGTSVTAGLRALASVPPTTLLVSLALSFAVGAFGAHFGDDLRNGLTRPLDTPSGGSIGVDDTTVTTTADVDHTSNAGRTTDTDSAGDADAEPAGVTDEPAEELERE